VVLFTDAELREQFCTLVHAYRHSHFRSADMESEDDRKHWADQAKLAEDTFKAMFANRFSSASLLEDNANDRIVERLLNLAVQLRSGHNIGEHAVRNTPEECSELLMNLTSEPAVVQGPVAWPYIKKIRYVVCSMYRRVTNTTVACSSMHISSGRDLCSLTFPVQ
jgi:hypothetical protein